MTVFNITAEVLEKGLQKSIEHHEDGASRTEDNYREFNLRGKSCALCAIFAYPEDNYDCSLNKLCPLYEYENNAPCNEVWRVANDAKFDRDFPAFHRAEVVQVKLLNEIRVRGYDAWFGGCIARMKGEEIECGYSHSIEREMHLLEWGKAIFRYTGDYRKLVNGDYYYDSRQNKAFQGYIEDKLIAPILEFVRMAGEPEKAKQEWAPEKCDDCVHEFEPAKPEYKVGNIVMTAFGLREIREMDKDGDVWFTSGYVANPKQINRLATAAEALKFWEDKYTVIRNGVVMRAYEMEYGDGITLFVNGWRCCYLTDSLILKALALDVIPYKYSQGVFTSPPVKE